MDIARILMAASVVAFCTLSGQSTRLKLGDPAPSVIVPSSKGLAAVAFPACSGWLGCVAELQALARVNSELGKLGFRLVAVIPHSPADITIDGVDLIFDGTRRIADAYDARDQALGVILENGIVRLVLSSRKGLAESLVEASRLWNRGGAIFAAQCARCHGDDGKDTSYPGVRSLGGIGNRISEQEILNRTSLTGAVDLSPLSREQLRALGVYVAGL